MKANYSLDDLRCFCTVAKLASFKKAAESLNMPLSTLSRRIKQLEEDLQLRLLNRDAHRVTLTHTGGQYYQRSYPLFDELNDVGQDLHQEKHQPKGKIIITAPIYSGKQFLRSVFYEFLLAYPEIQLDLRFSNTLIDIEEQGIDIAFRVRNPTIDNWVIRQLKTTRNILCGHPEKSFKHIKHPDQLTELPKVICSHLSPWQLENQLTGEKYNYHPNHLIRLEVDEIEMMTHAVEKGLGVGYIPDYLALPLIKAGKIKRLLPDWQSEKQPFSMLYRDRDNMPLRVRLFIDYVLKHFT
ncbi:LysR family transcriptional regulator [Colwellia echini]|uniref:LysR family transcriptional regulator n=1 Tax=Colwellia echini TaxID=1982103 RepID=A0ABY3MU17_9GAMM|nr:LysR family transcriptional regulator [Colwellia echini]TYK64567.1 LysR family transcriptional regulator [Colwellia echini]